MKSSRVFTIAMAIVAVSEAAPAAHVDFSDPRRALGRQDDIRVDAQLMQDTVSSDQPLNVTYQIENLSKATIAIADKVSDSTFDLDTQTITLTLGAEVPNGLTMPHMVIIRPGEKRVLTSDALPHLALPSARTPWTAVPRYVQIMVNVLRDVTPFNALIEQQSRTAIAQRCPMICSINGWKAAIRWC
jgi:hypothetical protein